MASGEGAVFLFSPGKRGNGGGKENAGSSMETVNKLYLNRYVPCIFIVRVQ